MSLKLDLLLEAIDEIDREDIIEESAGKNGIIERAAYEKYKAEKAKNDEYDMSIEHKRQLYNRAGYSDKAPKSADRSAEKDALKTYQLAKDNNDGSDSDSRRGASAEDMVYRTRTTHIISNTIYDAAKRNSKNTSVTNNRINMRAERAKKAMGESVEDHLSFANDLLELLD